MADEDLDLDVKTGGSKLKLIIIILVVLILVGGGVGGYLFMAGGDEAEGEGHDGGKEVAERHEPTPSNAIYMPLKPEFTINFADDSKARFLQLEITLMARDQAELDAVSRNLPIVQDDIITILGGKRYEELNTPEGKKKLAEEILAAIQQVVKQELHHPGVEAVYFTSFIMQ